MGSHAAGRAHEAGSRRGPAGGERGGERPRSEASAPAPLAAVLLALQRSAGNRAVQRAVEAGAPLGVQRFSVDAPDFAATSRARRTTSGAEGAVLLWDGTRDGLVVKATGDPMPESVIATMFHAKLTGSKRGIGAPKLRPATKKEREALGPIVETKVENWVEVAQLEQDYPTDPAQQRPFVDNLKRQARVKYETGAPDVQIMGMAKGKEFKDITKASPDQFAAHLRDRPYMWRLGFASAVDYFLGNTDRLNPNAANLGNWMSDDALGGTIALIDNFDVRGFQKLTQAAVGPGLKASEYQAEWGSKRAEQRGMKTRKRLTAATLKARRKGQTDEANRRRDAWWSAGSKTPLGWLADADSTAVRTIALMLDLVDQRYGVKPIDRATPQGRTEAIAIAQAFAAGLKEGRTTILGKMAPQVGKRSRTLKAGVMSSGGGQEAWEVLKARAKLLGELV